MEARRRYLQRYEGVTEAARLSAFLLNITRRLAKQLPITAKGQLLQSLRQYTEGGADPEKLAESMQQLVDFYGIMLAHDESTERVPAKKGAKAAKGGGAGKRSAAAGAVRAQAAGAKRGGKVDKSAEVMPRGQGGAGAGADGMGPRKLGVGGKGKKRARNEENAALSSGGASSTTCSLDTKAWRRQYS